MRYNNHMITITQLTRPTATTLKEINNLLKQLSLSGRQTTLPLLKKMVQDKNSRLFVVRDGKKIIGMATLIFGRKITNLKTEIEDMVIDEVYRGKGLGTRLMRTLMAASRKGGAKTINLTSRPIRVAANKLYRKLGFKIRATNPYYLSLKGK